jgi:two-component system, response regulator YesN
MYPVIIVDDEYMIKLTLRKLIDASSLPFQVVGEAEDGQAAMAAIEQSKPALVITDIRMPVMGGLELVEVARERNLRTEFIIISGHDDFAYAMSALRNGVMDYLLKPLKPDQLEETLQRVLDRFQTEEQAKLDRSEWLWYSKKKAEPLVKHLLLLNETEVVNAIGEIHKDLTGKIENEALLKQVYLDLLTFIEGEMEHQLNPTHRRLELMDWAAFSDQHDSICDAVKARVLNLMEDIRLTRNWVSHQNLKQASAYIKNHFAKESLSLQEVADISGMSPSYFSRSFKENFGISFIHFLTKLRMEQAKAMLADPHCKTYEIAYAVGYSDYPHFTKAFKKYWGLSPSEAKKRM